MSFPVTTPTPPPTVTVISMTTGTGAAAESMSIDFSSPLTPAVPGTTGTVDSGGSSSTTDGGNGNGDNGTGDGNGNDDGGLQQRGANYFFGFLITFVVLLLVFVACGIGSRRRFLARRGRAGAGGYGGLLGMGDTGMGMGPGGNGGVPPWIVLGSDGMGGVRYQKPVLFEKGFVNAENEKGEEMGWRVLVPLSVSLSRRSTPYPKRTGSESSEAVNSYPSPSAHVDAGSDAQRQSQIRTGSLSQPQSRYGSRSPSQTQLSPSPHAQSQDQPLSLSQSHPIPTLEPVPPPMTLAADTYSGTALPVESQPREHRTRLGKIFGWMGGRGSDRDRDENDAATANGGVIETSRNTNPNAHIIDTDSMSAWNNGTWIAPSPAYIQRNRNQNVNAYVFDDSSTNPEPTNPTTTAGTTTTTTTLPPNTSSTGTSTSTSTSTKKARREERERQRFIQLHPPEVLTIAVMVVMPRDPGAVPVVVPPPPVYREEEGREMDNEKEKVSEDGIEYVEYAHAHITMDMGGDLARDGEGEGNENEKLAVDRPTPVQTRTRTRMAVPGRLPEYQIGVMSVPWIREVGAVAAGGDS